MPASSPLLECVPNFSEGRRPEVIQAIWNAIAAVPGVRLLNLHMDADHNRSVITFIGTPEAVEEAAVQAAKVAADLIDMRQHQGEHPRIGATDRRNARSVNVWQRFGGGRRNGGGRTRFLDCMERFFEHG